MDEERDYLVLKENFLTTFRAEKFSSLPPQPKHCYGTLGIFVFTWKFETFIRNQFKANSTRHSATSASSFSHEDNARYSRLSNVRRRRISSTEASLSYLEFPKEKTLSGQRCRQTRKTLPRRATGHCKYMHFFS